MSNRTFIVSPYSSALVSSSSSSSSSSSVWDDSDCELPSQYKFLKVLGEGGFGCVHRCLKMDTQETVAVKIPAFSEVRGELSLMKKFMRHNFHQRNIVKLLDSFKMPFGNALVLEELDISLEQFLTKSRFKPLLLSDIRNIIQQTATALDALKSIRVIHTDLKPDNIMLVDHQRRPLQVKLIDFGLAMPRSAARQGMTVQTIDFRAPEITLGLPFTEAIDMWSLGCVMAVMVAGGLLFSGDTEYEILHSMIYLLGQLADHVLNDGLHTDTYFTRTETNGWRFQTPEEYWGLQDPVYDGPSGLSSLDHLKNERLETWNQAEALEREQCIELLKAMLKIDPTERITPSDVLTHPFILQTEVNDTSRSEDSPATAAEDKDVRPDDCSTSPETDEDEEMWWFTNPPPLVMFARLATANNKLKLQDAKSFLPKKIETFRNVSWTTTSEDTDCEPPATAPEDKDTNEIQPDDSSPSPTIPPSRVIYVRPATAENTLHWEDVERADSFLPKSTTSEDTDCEPPATAPEEEDSTNIQPDDSSPLPTIPPSCVIYVRPATAENTLHWEDVERADSFLPKSTTSEDTDCEPPATAPEDEDSTNIQPDDSSPLPTIPPSRVIYVRPATAENTLHWEDVERADSLQAGLKRTSEPSVTQTENDTRDTEKDTRDSEKDTTSELSPKKQKKRKNCFRRFFSWMKKRFCS